MKTRSLTLIAARPGRLRDGLRTVLTTVPQVEVVDPVDNRGSTLQMVAEHCPALVLLDFNLSADEVVAVLKQIKTEWPHIGCITLVDNRQQERMAKAAGADEVVRKGFPTCQLVEVVMRLLTTHGGS